MQAEYFPPIEAELASRDATDAPTPPSGTARIAAVIAAVISLIMLAAALINSVYHALAQFLGADAPAFLTDQKDNLETVVLVGSVITIVGSVLMLLWNFQFHRWASNHGKDSLPVYAVGAGAVGTALTFGMPWVPMLITGLNIEKEGSSGGTGIRRYGILATVFGVISMVLTVADGRKVPLIEFTSESGPLTLAAGVSAILAFGATFVGARRFLDDIKWFNRDVGGSGTFAPGKVTAPQRPLTSAADKGYLTNATAARTAYGSPGAAMPGYPGIVPGEPVVDASNLPLLKRAQDDKPKYISQYTFEDDTTPFGTATARPTSIPVPQDAAKVEVRPRAQVVPTEASVVDPQPVPSQNPAQSTIPSIPLAPLAPPAAAPAAEAPVVAAPAPEAPTPAPTPAVPATAAEAPPAPVVPAPPPAPAPAAASGPTYVPPAIISPLDLPAMPPVPDTASSVPSGPTYVPPTIIAPLDLPAMPPVPDTAPSAASGPTYVPPAIIAPLDVPPILPAPDTGNDVSTEQGE